ncbi:MAG: hypothetical protein HYY60_01555 [Parcubacteria group bacterium]|nr:hypothetical protein [Parcubacteria group bacterium]
MADKKIGRIVFGNKQKRTSFILEEGEEGKIYEFLPDNISGNLAAEVAYPLRHTSQHVIFVLDENGAVVSVFTLVFQKAVHDTCIMGAVAGGVRGCVCGNEIRSSYASCSVCALKAGNVLAVSKECACGNSTFRSYVSCDICAIKNGKCAKCGENIS